MQEMHRRRTDQQLVQLHIVKPFSRSTGKYGVMVQGLLSRKNRQVLLSCGNMLYHLKLTGHLIQGNGALMMKKELMATLNEIRPLLSARDFRYEGVKKETALIEVIELFAEMKANELLKDIAVNGSTKLSNHAVWALARHKDSEALLAVLEKSVVPTSRIIAERTLEKMKK